MKRRTVVARMRRKADLPTKVCPVCERPFGWRKKWSRDWDEVRYCSDRCRADGKSRLVDPSPVTAGLDPATSIREAWR